MRWGARPPGTSLSREIGSPAYLGNSCSARMKHIDNLQCQLSVYLGSCVQQAQARAHQPHACTWSSTCTQQQPKTYDSKLRIDKQIRIYTYELPPAEQGVPQELASPQSARLFRHLDTRYTKRERGRFRERFLLCVEALVRQRG